MKVLITVFMALSLLTAYGCWNSQNSNQGGIAPVNEEFSMTVPGSTTIKQGESAAIIVTLNRGAYFKQDVQLRLKADSVVIMPANVLVKAGDLPEAKFQVAVDKDAAIGEYRVTVTGVPVVGRTATTTFTVSVVSK